MVPSPNFTGDKKVPLRSPLAEIEHRVIQANVGRFPAWIEGYHLTLLTIAWTVGLIVFGWLARRNHHWLWGSSLMLFLQWFTDSFDGALGRRRDTGIPRWGFFMDHFLDFIFMSAVFVGYAFLFTGPARDLLYLLMLVYGAMMVSSFLAYGATGQFKITYLGVGPTEIRLLLIVLNTALIAWGITWLAAALPGVLAAMVAGLCFIVHRTQKWIWSIDMDEKAVRMRASAEK
ncbi:MAG: hypothetical protein M1457_01765 [bacterium]|nr:hypothetical protein [bacterium]